jgi:hypothetical protein
VIVFAYIQSSAGEGVYSFLEIRATKPDNVEAAAAEILNTAAQTAATNPNLALTMSLASWQMVSNNVQPDADGNISDADQQVIAQQQQAMLNTLTAITCNSVECSTKILQVLATVAAGSPTSIEFNNALVNQAEQTVQLLAASGSTTDAQTMSVFETLAFALPASGSLSSFRRRLTPHSSVALFATSRRRRRLEGKC